MRNGAWLLCPIAPLVILSCCAAHCNRFSPTPVLHTAIQLGFEDVARVAADKRLRNTNWAGEAAALLPDEQQLVKDAKLSSGDLLLLEDGMAPQKGALLVKVHLWAPPPADEAAE